MSGSGPTVFGVFDEPERGAAGRPRDRGRGRARHRGAGPPSCGRCDDIRGSRHGDHRGPRLPGQRGEAQGLRHHHARRLLRRPRPQGDPRQHRPVHRDARQAAQGRHVQGHRPPAQLGDARADGARRSSPSTSASCEGRRPRAGRPAPRAVERPRRGAGPRRRARVDAVRPIRYKRARRGASSRGGRIGCAAARPPRPRHRRARSWSRTDSARTTGSSPGNSNPKLAAAICAQLGRPLSQATVGRFSDGEIQVEIGENVRGARHASSSSRPAATRTTT